MNRLAKPFRILQGGEDHATLELRIPDLGPGGDAVGQRLGTVGDALPGYDVVGPHAVHVHGPGTELSQVGHLVGRELLEQALLDGQDHHRIVHLHDGQILLVLVLLHFLEVHQRARALVDDPAIVLLLEERLHGALDPRLVARRAADHDLLGLCLEDGGRCDDPERADANAANGDPTSDFARAGHLCALPHAVADLVPDSIFVTARALCNGESYAT